MPPANQPQIKYTMWGVICLCLFVVLAYKGITEPHKNSQLSVVPAPLPVRPVVLHENPYAKVTLLAKSAYVLDVTTGQPLFELNAKTQQPLASLTKIMTAVIASTLIPEDTKVTIGKHSLLQDGDSGLHPGEKWNIRDLIRFTLLVSSNDGAHAVANALSAVSDENGTPLSRKAFIIQMNETAKTLGLTKTYFLNESGLDESTGVSGGYGSAEDVAKLFKYGVTHYPEIFTITKEKVEKFISENKVTHLGTNTNKIVEDIPGLIASKTGLTDLAGGNLVIEFLPTEDHPVIIVVMGSTPDGRFADMLTLVKATQKYYTYSQ